MMDEPIVLSEVDEPDTMVVTRASVEMATGPPAPPAVPEPPVLDLVAVAFEPVPVTDFPVVDVSVTVPVAAVTVSKVVVLAPEAPVAVARAEAQYDKPYDTTAAS